MPLSADICILGGGPGGYVAALRASALGSTVILVESSTVGGVCLARGCIPTKALLRSAEIFQLCSNARSFGINAGKVEADYEAIAKRKDRIVGQLIRGVQGLLRSADVTVIEGWGRMAGPGAVEVALPDRTELITAPIVIIATGSSASAPPIPGADLEGVIDSDGALALQELPSHIVVTGAGAVGVEWASLFALLGAQVTLVEMLPRLVPNEDAEISTAMRKILVQQGMTVHTETRIDTIEKKKHGLGITIQSAGTSNTVDASHLLLATGRKPNVENLGLESCGVQFSPAGISVNAHMQTTVPTIYAVGDVTGGKLLAHVASHQGVVAAEHANGHPSIYDNKAVPACTFTHPEIASVGLTEQEARESYESVQVGVFPFQALGRARAYGDTDGFVKVVAGASHGEILGVHIIGPAASDIISEGVLAIRLEATMDDLRETIHAHPTFAEATAESAWMAINSPIHLPLPNDSSR
jgi:dihydrolipoamide dehydrogenase